MNDGAANALPEFERIVVARERGSTITMRKEQRLDCIHDEMFGDEDTEPPDIDDQQEFARQKAHRIQDLRDSVQYFGQANKTARERYVVDALLRNLGTRFRASEILSVDSREEPPDVRFRSANFEIKEVLDSARRRHDELKKDLFKIERATTISELFPLEDYTPLTITVAQLCSEVTAASAAHAARYGMGTANRLDLLIYFNRSDFMDLDASTHPDVGQLRAQGWRSVAVVFHHLAVVLFASKGAPRFLRLRTN